MEDNKKEVIENEIKESSKSLNESIINIRVKLQNAKLKKSGKNKFAGFDYFELADFLPKLNELMLEEKVNDKFNIESDEAVLTLIKGEETQVYKMPFVLFDTPINKKYNKELDEYVEVKSMQDIQYLGALNTYYKRYLYLNAFGITDGEVIDSMNNEEMTTETKTTTKKQVKTASPKQVAMLLQAYTGDNLKKLLEVNKIEKIEDMPMAKASQLISAIMEKKNKEGEQ